MDFPTLPRPAFLNGNDAFNISKPFSVGDRLEALAYQMSVAPPQANELVMPPSVSASKSTTYMVEKDHKCTVRPLRAPPPDFIQEILPMEIDLTPSSPLTIAIEGSDLSRLFTIRGRITMPTMPRESTPDRDENDYLPIVTGALANMVTLAAILLLQQWIHDGANHTDPDAFHRAVGILIYLGPSSVIKDNDCKPDHAAMGPQPENTENQLVITHGSSYAVAMVDRKSRAFAEYRHDPSPNGFRSRTKDGLIQEIIHDGRPFCRIWKELTSGDIKRGWRVETLHLIAQMKVQCLRACSGMSLFTSVYAFNRVALVENDQLYVSENLTQGLGQANRKNPQTNRPFLELFFVFLIVAVAKTYPEAVSPHRRESYSRVFIPDIIPKEQSKSHLPAVPE